jgi:hypothetical protein
LAWSVGRTAWLVLVNRPAKVDNAAYEGQSKQLKGLSVSRMKRAILLLVLVWPFPWHAYATTFSTAQIAERIGRVAVARTSGDVSVGSQEPTRQFPLRWRSLDTGLSYVMDNPEAGGFSELKFFAEYPAGRVVPGTHTFSKLKKEGNRWVGHLYSQLVCRTPRQQYNTCYFSFDMEITRLTPSRIEGSATWPGPSAQLDCLYCSWSHRPERRPFVWVPE